jgi:hypothetical protein
MDSCFHGNPRFSLSLRTAEGREGRDKVLTKQSMQLVKERLPRLLRNLAMTDKTERKDCHSPSGFAMTDKTKRKKIAALLRNSQ